MLRLATSLLKIESLINEIDRCPYWRGASSIIKIESEPLFHAETQTEGQLLELTRV
jgi:hypothetical protein